MKHSLNILVWSSMCLVQMLCPGCAGDGSGDEGDRDAASSDFDTADVDSNSDTGQDTEETDTLPAIDTDGTCEGDASPCEELAAILCYVQQGCTSSEYCTGSARLCETIVIVENCERQQNCFFDGSCVGSATPCSNIQSSMSCSSQRGCVWDGVGQRCSGLVVSCYQLGTETCGQQRGCTLSGTCKGVAVDCDAVPIGKCGGQLGCRIEKDCNGISAPCQSIEDYWNCEDQQGCTWN